MEVRDVTVKFGGLIAASEITMDIEEGAIHSLIGPNGAGKTTMFNVITRVIDPNEGDVIFNGESLLKSNTVDLLCKVKNCVGGFGPCFDKTHMANVIEHVHL